MKKRSGKVVQLAELDLVAVLKPTDRVIWGQGGAEPLRLIEALVAQRSAYSGIRVFLTISFAEVMQPEHSDHIRFEGLGGLGSNARLCRDGLLDVYPTHFGSFCRDIAASFRDTAYAELHAACVMAIGDAESHLAEKHAQQCIAVCRRFLLGSRWS